MKILIKIFYQQFRILIMRTYDKKDPHSILIIIKLDFV